MHYLLTLYYIILQNIKPYYHPQQNIYQMITQTLQDNFTVCTVLYAFNWNVTSMQGKIPLNTIKTIINCERWLCGQWHTLNPLTSMHRIRWTYSGQNENTTRQPVTNDLFVFTFFTIELTHLWLALWSPRVKVQLPYRSSLSATWASVMMQN